LKKYGNASSEIYTPEKEISILARSVTTVVYELEPTTGIVIPVSENTSMQVYPNPVEAGEKVTIRLPEIIKENLLLTIYSSQGILVYSKTASVHGSSLELPALYLPQGVYLLKIQAGTPVFHSKIVIH
jgi:hypothetical protein